MRRRTVHGDSMKGVEQVNSTEWEYNRKKTETTWNNVDKPAASADVDIGTSLRFSRLQDACLHRSGNKTRLNAPLKPLEIPQGTLLEKFPSEICVFDTYFAQRMNIRRIRERGKIKNESGPSWKTQRKGRAEIKRLSWYLVLRYV